MRFDSGVQQREPSVLQVIVDSVSGMEGASHSSSSPTSVPRDEAGEKPSLNSICLMPHSGPCSCRESVCALERHRVVGVPPLADQRGRLDAGVQSSTSMRGVACVLFWCSGVEVAGLLGGGGVVPAPLGRCCCLSGGGGGRPVLSPVSSGDHRGGSSRSETSSSSSSLGGSERCAAVTNPCKRGHCRRPMSASVSALVLPCIPTCEGTSSQRTAGPARVISCNSCSHRSTWPTGPRDPCQSCRCHLLALPVAPMTTSCEQIRVLFPGLRWRMACSAALISPRLLVCFSLIRRGAARSLWSQK